METLRARACSTGRAKLLLGVAILPVLGIAMPWLLLTYGGSGVALPAIGMTVLFWAQGIYLIYRGQRQLRVARGDVHEAVVLHAMNQSLQPQEKSLTCKLMVEVTLPDGGESVATSTNVFGNDTGTALEGQKVKVLWSHAYPFDAYVIVDN